MKMVYISVMTKESFDSPMIEKQIACKVLDGDPDLNERLTVEYSINGKKEMRVVDRGAYSLSPITLDYL